MHPTSDRAKQALGVPLTTEATKPTEGRPWPLQIWRHVLGRLSYDRERDAPSRRGVEVTWGMRLCLLVALCLLEAGCAFTTMQLTLPTKTAGIPRDAGGGRQVVVMPFADERAIGDRCGMKKNGYNMDTADAVTALRKKAPTAQTTTTAWASLYARTARVLPRTCR